MDFRKTLLGGAAALALASLSFSASAQLTPYILPGPQVSGFIPGDAIIAGKAPPAIKFTGQITVTTVGSVTTGILSVVQPNTTSRVLLPIGAVITGGGATAGTVIVQQYPGTDNYQVITTGGTIAATTAAAALTATPKFTYAIQDTVATTAPTYTSGGCTAGSPGFATGDTTSGWTFTNGTGTCSGGNTVTFGFPAANVSWMCVAQSTLNPTTDFYISTGAASTTVVVFTDYSALGVAQNTKANDVITGSCTPR